MATTYVAKQIQSVANTETDLYTVPAVTWGQILSIFICNKGAVQDTFTISLSVGGAATDPKDYLYYQVTLASHDSFLITTPIFVHTADKIRIKSVTTDISYNLFAVETS